MKKNLASFLKFPVYEKLGNAISLPTPSPILIYFPFYGLFWLYGGAMSSDNRWVDNYFCNTWYLGMHFGNIYLG